MQVFVQARRQLVAALLLAVLPQGTLRGEDSSSAEALKVHFLGSGEYQAVESLTAFKEYLEQNYCAEVTTSFSKNPKSLPNLEQLKAADIMLIFMRRMDLPPEQMAMIRAHWEQGKPIVGLRTASHAFQKEDIAALSKVLGGEYLGPGSYTAPFRALVAAGQAGHPILQGIQSIDSRGPYRFALAKEAVVLQVVESDKQVKAPVSWVHEQSGRRTFFSLMGVPEDFQKEEFRRLLVNAIFWTARRDVAKR